MHDLESTIIPLDDAHEVFSVFGISPYSREYQRSKRDDGFRQIDLEGVLNESGLILSMDWRGCLNEAVEVIVGQLSNLEISVNVQLDDEGNQGTFEIGDKSAEVKYVPADEDDFDEVIVSVNRLIGFMAHYKKFRSCEGSDGWVYALLKNEDWQALISSVPRSLNMIFKDVFTS